MFFKTALLFVGAFVATILSTTVAMDKGHDLSSVTMMEKTQGARWVSTSGNTTTIEYILGEGGMNSVRLRLWTDGENDLDYTLALAKRFSKAGFKIYLDMHFSDTWADPHHQTIPAAWDKSSIKSLSAAIRSYVKTTLKVFTDDGVDVDILSLGNEITHGFLFPLGKVTNGNYANFATLWKAARQGVNDAVSAGTKKPTVMIHIDSGWNHGAVSKFFTGLFATGTVTTQDIDVFGFSFYPFYGAKATIHALKSSLTQVAKKYNKPIYIAETDWPTECSGVKLSENYPLSADGQNQWVAAIIEVLNGLPNNLGAGIFYWEPACLLSPGLGSSCQSALLFSVNRKETVTHAKALPSVNMFA